MDASYCFKYNEGDIVYSIVTPIFNQQDIIVRNLKSVLSHTQGSFEVILILDYCFDKTERNLLDYLKTYKNDNKNLIQIKIFKSRKPIFETKCDNIGFRNSIGKYCLEIQSDMEMTEYGYNLHLTKPFKLLDNIIAVSGRGGHNFINHRQGRVGRLGPAIAIRKNWMRKLNISKNKFYITQTVMRGPLLFERKKLKELNFLNEDDFFLAGDDHDLIARAYAEKGYICGYVPIDFNAPPKDGSDRKQAFYKRINPIAYAVNQKERHKRRPNAERARKNNFKKYERDMKSKKISIIEM